MVAKLWEVKSSIGYTFFTKDGRHLIIVPDSQHDNVLLLIRISDFKTKDKRQINYESPESATISSNRKFLGIGACSNLTESQGDNSYIIEAKSLMDLQVFDSCNQDQLIVFSPDDKLVAIGGWDSQVRIFAKVFLSSWKNTINIFDTKYAMAGEWVPSYINAITFDNYSQYIYVGTCNNTSLLKYAISSKSDDPKSIDVRGIENIDSLHMSSNDKLFIADRVNPGRIKIRIYDPAADEINSKLSFKGSDVFSCICMSSDRKNIACGTVNGEIIIWDVVNMKYPPQTIDPPAEDLAGIPIKHLDINLKKDYLSAVYNDKKSGNALGNNTVAIIRID